MDGVDINVEIINYYCYLYSSTQLEFFSWLVSRAVFLFYLSLGSRSLVGCVSNNTLNSLHCPKRSKFGPKRDEELLHEQIVNVPDSS